MRYFLSLTLSFLFLAACTAKQSLPPPSDVPPEDVGSPTAAMPVPGEDVEEMQVSVVNTVE